MPDQVKYTNRLQDSRVLVIGGSSGIGFCVAEACLEYGALVAIASSNQSRVGSAVSRLQSSYPSAKSKIHGLVADLSEATTLEDELKQLFEGTKQALGGEKLDHVVFTAGDALSTIPLSEMTMEKIIQAGQVRFFAPLMIAKFLPTYIHQTRKSSYTITTGSVSEKPIPGWSVISSYAGGLHSMVRNLALDLKPLRVNGVSPGAVDTELWKMDKEEKEKLLKEFAKKMATGAPGQPEHVAESFLSCFRDENLDGTMLRTDGGSFLM